MKLSAVGKGGGEGGQLRRKLHVTSMLRTRCAVIPGRRRARRARARSLESVRSYELKLLYKLSLGSAGFSNQLGDKNILYP